MTTQTVYRVTLVKSWQDRRVASGKVQLNADQLWARIRASWPTATEAEQEEIFSLAG